MTNGLRTAEERLETHSDTPGGEPVRRRRPGGLRTRPARRGKSDSERFFVNTFADWVGYKEVVMNDIKAWVDAHIPAVRSAVIDGGLAGA